MNTKCLGMLGVGIMLTITPVVMAAPPLAQNSNDSQPDSNAIPQGVVVKRSISNDLFGWIKLNRDYYVYVPAQYDAADEASVMVFQDGHFFADEKSSTFDPKHSVAKLFDELIHAQKMPVTIAICVNPGHNDTNYPENLFECSKRSEEYDELSDRYATFLIEKLIPQVEKDYRLTKDPKQRAIAGFSSGGVCAFTAAWQRPDFFHRVMSFSGSYVNIRGGHVYPYLVRSTPKKDIKVYLQSGSNDLDIMFGNWWLANQQMAAALRFKGYDYRFQETTGEHGQFIADHFKAALEWLWHDAVK